MQIVKPSKAKRLKKKAIKEKLLFKGKKLGEGTIRTHGGKKVQKKDGKWVPYREGAKKEGRKGQPIDLKNLDAEYTPNRVWSYQSDRFRKGIAKLAKQKGMTPKQYFEKEWSSKLRGKAETAAKKEPEEKATTKQKAVAGALSALEKEFGTTGLSPEVNDAMIALRKMLPAARHKQGPRFMAEKKITKMEPKSQKVKPKSMIPIGAPVTDFPSQYDLELDADLMTESFSKGNVVDIANVVKAADKITKVEVLDNWTDDHEFCCGMAVTVADKEGNLTKLPLSMWWCDPAIVYKAEGGSKEAQADLLEDFKATAAV